MLTYYIIISEELQIKCVINDLYDVRRLVKELRKGNIGYNIKIVQEDEIDLFWEYQGEKLESLTLLQDSSELLELIKEERSRYRA